MPSTPEGRSRSVLHVFAEWSPRNLLDDRPAPGRRSLQDAFEQVCRQLGQAGVSLRVHWVWPVLGEGRSPFALSDYRAVLGHIEPLGAALSLWPVIERRRGYFLHPRTSAVFEARLAGLARELQAEGLAGRVGLTVDLELPLPWLRGQLRAPLGPPDPASFARLAAHLKELRADGTLVRLQAAVIPGRLAGAHYDDRIVMAYGSLPDITGRLEAAYPQVTALLTAVGGAAAWLDRTGRRPVVALGLLNRGVLMTESTFTRPEVFARAVRRAAPRGTRELALYGLCGLLCGPEGLVTPDPSLDDRWDPVPPRTVRDAAELARWVSPLATALQT